MNKLDLLCFAAHPDDIELSCGGTILKHIDLGYKVGIVELTQGELGTRGSKEIRAIEAANSSKILGISVRENLKLADCFFEKNKETLLKIIEKIRHYKPEIIICNAEHDRHIDHGRASDLVNDAAFLSGLLKIETFYDGELQAPWRPKQIYNCIQDRMSKPDIIIDITPYFDKKIESVLAFESQFYNPNSTEPATPISSLAFLEYLKGRALEFGRLINTEFGEGFTVKRPVGANHFMDLL